jgi:DNA polymerase III epsilon subunit-like protein
MSKSFEYSTMWNWNGHMLCAIDTETTGLIPGQHDMYQMAIIPLDANIKPNKTYMPFDFTIKPMPHRLESYKDTLEHGMRTRVAKAILSGFTYDHAADIFDTWFQKLKLAPNKKIIPLAHFWPHDRAFILDWLGLQSFNQYFDWRYRDLMTACLTMNDRADMRVEQIPYPKLDLGYICSQLRVERLKPHEAISDAMATAEAYRKLIHLSLGW